MLICLFIYIYIYIYMFIFYCIWICSCLCKYGIFLGAHIKLPRVAESLDLFTSTYICMIHEHMYIYIYMYDTWTYVYIYIYICMYILNAGAYIKLPRVAESLDLSQMNADTPYSIMFGPDKCGNHDKIHFIIQHLNPISGQFEVDYIYTYMYIYI
jgi:hypothetical protein